jgi:hypothetical protein
MSSILPGTRQAIDESGTGVMLTGRSEGFVAGRPDIDDRAAERTPGSGSGRPLVTSAA